MQQPVKSVEQYYNMRMSAKGSTGQQGHNRINLTYGDIDTLFKGLSRTQKTLNKSSVAVKGTQLKG